MAMKSPAEQSDLSNIEHTLMLSLLFELPNKSFWYDHKITDMPRLPDCLDVVFSCLRLRQWPVTYLITLSDWIMSCQPGHHAVVTVCEPDWKHKWAAYKSFDETSSFNNL